MEIGKEDQEMETETKAGHVSKLSPVACPFVLSEDREAVFGE